MLRSNVSFATSRRRGNVTVLVALLMPVLIGVMALALDAGVMYIERRHAQSTADAAALAGAYALYNGSNFSTAQSAAIAMGTSNNITITSSQVTSPQTSYIAVTVTTSQPKFFSGLWGSGTMPATASATARCAGGSVKQSIILLSPNGTDLSAKGNGSMTIIGGSVAKGTGSVVVDSSSGSAVTTNGNATLTAPAFYITGNQSGANLVGTVYTGASPMADPLSYLPAPSGLINQTYTGQTYLQPGVYTGGISLSGNSSVTLASGIYYMKGGGFSLAGNANLTGSGVMIYNDSGGGSISIAGNGSVSLSPMTSGTYSGITVFQSGSNTNDVSLTGNGSFNLTGAIYAPGALVSIVGNGDTIGSQLIAADLSMKGNGAVNVNFGASTLPGGGLALVR